MDLGIKGRKAIVCAASRGLGRGCAEALADAGVDLWINGIDADRLEQAADELRAKGVSVTAIAGDISNHKTHDTLFAACPNPDILINNNAGPPLKDFRDLDRQAVLAGVTSNMITPIELIQRCIDPMAAAGFGRIINITSLSVYRPLAGLDLSSGARAGLTAFLAGVAPKVAASNVTINSLLPGKFDTDRIRSTIAFAAKSKGVDADVERANQMAAIPAGRFGTAAEFGAMCAFLCSVHAGYITGRNIILDGGVHQSAF